LLDKTTIFVESIASKLGIVDIELDGFVEPVFPIASAAIMAANRVVERGEQADC